MNYDTWLDKDLPGIDTHLEQAQETNALEYFDAISDYFAKVGYDDDEVARLIIKVATGVPVTADDVKNTITHEQITCLIADKLEALGNE